MVNLKQIVMASGLGLAGMVQAADVKDTGYGDVTFAQSRKMVLDRATPVTYNSFKQEVLDYDGAVLVLFNSSCPQDEDTEIVDRNMNIVYAQLADKFKDTKINGIPLKFTEYDICGRAKADLLGMKDGGPDTWMYQNGKLIDRMSCGPTDEKSIGIFKRNMGDIWIPLNITAPRSDYTGLYYGKCEIQKVEK